MSVPKPPVKCAVSWIALPTTTGPAVAVVVIVGQALMLTCSGAMKSLISAWNESEERLFT